MSRPVFVLLALAASMLAFAACSSDDTPPPTESGEQATQIADGEPMETISVPVRWASAIASDLSTLTANSDAVFVGRVVRLKSQREEPLAPGLEASAPADGKPSRQPGTFPISTFEVRVQQAISGGYDASSVVLIEQAGGTSERADGSRVRLALEDDQPLEPGHRYLFFVRQKENGTLSAAPFARLLFTDRGLEPVPPWSNLGAMRALSGRTADEATSLVEAAGR